jgi:hypothetical protein
MVIEPTKGSTNTSSKQGFIVCSENVLLSRGFLFLRNDFGSYIRGEYRLKQINLVTFNFNKA